MLILTDIQFMNRIAYFGTWGKPGHGFIAIQGQFTAKEIRGISKIDHPVFIEPTTVEGFHYFCYDHFLGYGIPFSIDDRRPGCISAVFVEYATEAKDIINALDNHPELKRHFLRRLPKPSDI